jgi:hypothetical protein
MEIASFMERRAVQFMNPVPDNVRATHSGKKVSKAAGPGNRSVRNVQVPASVALQSSMFKRLKKDDRSAPFEIFRSIYRDVQKGIRDNRRGLIGGPMMADTEE